MKHSPLSNLSTFRIETLEDGVFAIALTLLVLDLKVPETDDIPILYSLINMWPNFLTFFGSFLLLGVFWFGHRAAMNLVKHADHIYHWLNIILLMFVSVVPFSSSLLSKYYYNKFAIALYGLNLIAIGATLSIQWHYASHNHRLTDPELPEQIRRFALVRSLFAPIMYFIAVILALVNFKISLIIYTVVPTLYIFPFFKGFWNFCVNISFKKA